MSKCLDRRYELPSVYLISFTLFSGLIWKGTPDQMMAAHCKKMFKETLSDLEDLLTNWLELWE